MVRGVPAVSVLGFSDTGKTTFIEALVARAVSDGRRVTCIKYGRSPGNFDRPGSDTDIVRRAGAAVTAYRGESGWFVQVGDPQAGPAHTHPTDIDNLGPRAELPEWLLDAGREIDLVVSEGRLIPGSIVVLAAGSAETTDALKYDIQMADVVLGSHELAHRVDGAVPVLPVDAAVSFVIDQIEKGGR